MNAQEVADLLRFCSSVDPWLKQTSPEEGAVMVGGWALMLEAMPADVAMRAARLHYSTGEARTLTPGDLLDVWATSRKREHQASVDAAARVEVQQELEGAVPGVFGSAAPYLADMMAAVARGEDPATIPTPAGVRVRNLSPEGEARERQCAFPSICVCTHLECRDGWLDVEEVRVNALGKAYPAVRKCPRCDDGLQMAVERGLVRKPRRTTGAR